MQHVVFFIGRMIDWGVPDVPESLQLKMKRETYLAKQALTDNIEADVPSVSAGTVFHFNSCTLWSCEEGNVDRGFDYAGFDSKRCNDGCLNWHCIGSGWKRFKITGYFLAYWAENSTDWVRLQSELAPFESTETLCSSREANPSRRIYKLFGIDRLCRHVTLAKICLSNWNGENEKSGRGVKHHNINESLLCEQAKWAKGCLSTLWMRPVRALLCEESHRLRSP